MHSKSRLEGVNDKCETLNQARKDPEAEVRSAALATQEALTYNPQCASGNYITAGPYP